MDGLKPTELYLGLESGFYSTQDAIDWADFYIATYGFDDDVANISLATHQTPKEVMGLLRKLAKDECRVRAMRSVLGRMSIELEKSEDVSPKIVQYCEQFSIAQDYELPEDMQFMVALDDDFYLASEGILGTMEEAMDRLKQDLAKFRKYTKHAD